MFYNINKILGLIYGKSNDEIDYQWEDEYLYGQMYSGLTYDGTTRSRPMVNNANNGDLKVETPAELSRQFDSIAYDKAGSVMLFIREIIGHENWISGKKTNLSLLTRRRPAPNFWQTSGWSRTLETTISQKRTPQFLRKFACGYSFPYHLLA